MQKSANHFEGDIIVREDQGYCYDFIQCPFVVPENAKMLRIKFRYSPLETGHVNNLITLGLFDPPGFRGNAHRHPPDAEIIVTEDKASPGFLAGRLTPGRWLAQLAVHCALASSPPCHYSIDIEIEFGLTQISGTPEHAPLQNAVASPADPPPHHVGGRWYRGELHSHTIHSDGTLTPVDLVAQARLQHYDFLAVTDHNTTSALGEIDPSSLDGMLLIPGMELTTFTGHALVLGVDRWTDWRTGYNGWTMDDAARAARVSGGLFIIAHPGAVGSPICTGCQWDFPDFDLDQADGFEVWNGPSQDATDQNPKGLAMWHELQARGRRIPATGGGDFHGLMDWREGTPCVYIYAQALTVPAILDGIRQGRLIITSGPGLSLKVQDDGVKRPAEIGDILRVKSSSVTVSVGWKEAPQGANLTIRNPRGPVLTTGISGEGSIQHLAQIEKEDRVWVEVYDSAGVLLAITNPVFISRELQSV